MILLAASAFAEDAPVETHGDVRLTGTALDDFEVDADGTTHGQTAWADERIRLGLRARPSPLGWLDIEADVLTGQIAGDTWKLGDADERDRGKYGALAMDGFVPRRFAATAFAGNTQIEAGLVSSMWGLGMVANDGAADPVFGRSDLADRTLRVRATRIPFRDGPSHRIEWLFTGAADLVVADDVARLSEGQKAFQGIFSVLGMGRGAERIGTYVVLREQLEADPGRDTTALVVDGYAATERPLGSWTLAAATELAAIGGRTDRATTYNSPYGVGVLSGGGAGRVALVSDDERLRTELFAGYASGDARPDDAWSHDFSFDRNFGVGAVLFDEVAGAIEARTYELLVDPEIAGRPPDGVDALLTEGSFRRAAYAQPVLGVRPHPWVDVRAGVLVARATAPVAHALYSTRAGGVPTNHLGLPSEGRTLGTEFDWAVAIARPIDREGVRPAVEVQGGHLFVGPALRGSDPLRIDRLSAAARLRW